MSKSLEIKDLDIYYDKFKAVEKVNMHIKPRAVTALIGPSGCGKSTFLRSINRMHEMQDKAYVKGEVQLDGLNIYDRGINPADVRRQIGMVFQKPNPFPNMSIAENVLAGKRLTNKKMPHEEAEHLVEKSLKSVGLWKEVKDRLSISAMGLSGGQQQRLCIARAIAVRPEVLLMDEPCSALDPISTLAIEELILELSSRYTIVMVTHNMQQAARVSDETAFFNLRNENGTGGLIEFGKTEQIFHSPQIKATADYISGRFG